MFFKINWQEKQVILNHSNLLSFIRQYVYLLWLTDFLPVLTCSSLTLNLSRYSFWFNLIINEIHKQPYKCAQRAWFHSGRIIFFLTWIPRFKYSICPFVEMLLTKKQSEDFVLKWNRCVPCIQTIIENLLVNYVFLI